MALKLRGKARDKNCTRPISKKLPQQYVPVTENSRWHWCLKHKRTPLNATLHHVIPPQPSSVPATATYMHQCISEGPQDTVLSPQLNQESRPTRRLGVSNITQKRTPGSTKHARRGFPCQAAASHTYPCGLGATMMASKLQGQVACSRGKLLTVTAANQPTTPLALPGLSVTVPNHRVQIFI